MLLYEIYSVFTDASVLKIVNRFLFNTSRVTRVPRSILLFTWCNKVKKVMQYLKNLLDIIKTLYVSGLKKNVHNHD